MAHHSAKDLLGLIGDILDIVRIESGHLSLAPEVVDLAALVESVGRMFDGQARQKGLALEVIIEPAARCHALLDPLRFKQVLSNLVSNAIKFTEHGQVRICVSLLDEAPGRPAMLDLEVRACSTRSSRPTRTARVPARAPGSVWPSAATCAT